jgi:hypothetical protein
MKPSDDIRRARGWGVAAVLLGLSVGPGCSMESQVLEQRMHESESRLAEVEQRLVDQLPAKERQIAQLQQAIVGYTNRIREAEAALAAQSQRAGDLAAALEEAKARIARDAAAPVEAPEPVVMLDEIRMKSGTGVVCRVQSYEEGFFMVQLGEGVKKARVVDVERIDMRSVTPKSNTDILPPIVVTNTAAIPVIDRTGGPAFVPEKGIVLSPRWRSGARHSSSVTDFIRGLFKETGKAAMDLDPKVGVLLPSNIPYLSNIAQALKIAPEKMPSRNPVDCPVFPADSFFYYKFDGAYEGGCSEMLVLTDIEDKVVGVQFGDDSPRGMRFEQGRHSAELNLFNIVEYKRKASRDWKVASSVKSTNQLIRVELELVSPESGSEWKDRPREYSRLYLPQPMVNLMLYIAEQD